MSKKRNSDIKSVFLFNKKYLLYEKAFFCISINANNC